MAASCIELVRTLDWGNTPIGPQARWPASLRATVANLLHTRQPMLLFWGPELIQVYNDAFVPSFGHGKHPSAMGQRARECWADAWPVVGAQIEGVMTRGEPAWFENALVPIFRNGRMEEVFWTYSYSPAHDDQAAIYGTLVIVTETTGRVLAARRFESLARLSVALSEATDHEDAFDAVVALAEHGAADVPCMVIRDGERIVRAVGLDDAGRASVGTAMDTAGLTRDLREMLLGVGVPGRVWPEAVTTAVGCALASRSIAVAFGVSPRLALDEAYRSFIAQVVEQLASTLRRIDNANASATIEEERDNVLMQAPVAAALMAGPDLVFQLANHRYRDLVARDVVGMTFAEAFPELVGTPAAEAMYAAYRTGEPIRTTDAPRALARDDAQYVSYAVEPLRDDDDVVYGLMVIAFDTTEQVRARQALGSRGGS